jgi:hypothetical protein
MRQISDNLKADNPEVWKVFQKKMQPQIDRVEEKIKAPKGLEPEINPTKQIKPETTPTTVNQPAGA